MALIERAGQIPRELEWILLLRQAVTQSACQRKYDEADRSVDHLCVRRDLEFLWLPAE